ncbi:MAG: DegT/DnrJ/EryC1/StrS family aminotransferase [Candidatus Omnitrophica bacterium]|nr:DegT/DnrJ/EryC1/StrS family aminotransferase [Candidatus Omnitrophota bacterium]
MGTAPLVEQKSIPLFKVFIPESVLEPLREVLFSGIVTEGEQTREFERRLGEYLDTPRTLALNACTHALQLALRLAGVGPGDEVISSPMTCVATNSPVLAAGASIRWADIDPQTGNIDPQAIERAITPKSKAILYVHWAGDPAPIDEINAVARAHGLKVIEDAAHAFGAEYGGRKLGSHSDFVCFSFQAIKHMTTVDGGALCCKSEEDYRRGKTLRWFGIDREARREELFWDYNIQEYGYKYHMNNVTAAIGIEQLKHVDRTLAAHRRNGAFYLQALQDVPKLAHLRRSPKAKAAFWVFTMLVEGREAFVTKLKAQGITTSIVHVRNDAYDAFKAFRRRLPGVDAFASRYISIPCGWWVTEDDAQRIAEIIRQGW